MGTRELALARLLTLYLVSLTAASSAELAWRPPSLPRLAALAGGLGLALGLGALLADALSGVGAAAVRRRARLLAVLLVPLPSLFALTVAWTAPSLGAEAASALVLVQGAILLVGEALGLELLALWGALVLSLLAAAGGGLTGAVALTSFLVLVGVFFALDHVVTRLAIWPGVSAPAPGAVVADALRTLAAPVLLLGLALSVLPPSTPAASRGGGLLVADVPEVRRAYEWLILVALAGTGSLALVFRWLRGREGDAPPLVEMAESHVEAEEILEPEAAADPRYAPARGRVIRAYLRFLARAREAGLRLDRCLTPREIEGRVRQPEEPLGLLTGLFMEARYGPEDPSADAVGRAEGASQAICADLRARRRSRRRATVRQLR